MNERTNERSREERHQWISNFSVNQWSNDPTNQWNDSVNQWLSESVIQWINDPTHEWTCESMNQRMSESMNQWTSESLNQWITDSVNQWISESVLFQIYQAWIGWTIETYFRLRFITPFFTHSIAMRSGWRLGAWIWTLWLSRLPKGRRNVDAMSTTFDLKLYIVYIILYI